MKLSRKLKLYSLILIFVMLFNVVAFSLTTEEYFDRAHVAHESTYTISNGVDYTKTLVYDDKLGYQNMYKFDINTNELSELVFAQGESLYSRKYMSSLIESIDEEKGVPVGALNADFFNMSTGVPESCFIKDGVVYTSDRDNYCFAKRSDGTYFFGIPKIKLSMTRGETEYNIVFLNKELTNQGIFMYTDVFADTTKIDVPTTEIVVYPYLEKHSPYEVAQMYFGDNNVPSDLYIDVEIPHQEQIEEPTEQSENQTLSQEDLDKTNAENYEFYVNEQDTQGEENNDKNYMQNEQEPTVISALNDDYTLFLDMFASDMGMTRICGNYYVLDKASPKIGQSQKAVVAYTRRNTEGKSLEIPKGAYVLSADNKGYGYTLSNFNDGETVTINVSSEEDFVDVTDAIGCGAIIVKDGEIVENTALSHYSAANPRSAVGIKEDGSVVLFAVDGRKKGTSTGLTLSELSAEMIRAGCVEAANFDGGGSTTVKVSIPLYDDLKTVNLPSDSSERKIANAVVVTNKSDATGNAVNSYIVTEKAFVLKGNSFVLGDNIFYTDENHFGVKSDIEADENETFDERKNEDKSENEMQTVEVNENTEESQNSVDEENVVNESANIDTSKFTYSAKYAKVEDGVYYPGEFVGTDYIISTHENGNSNVAATVTSTDKVDKIELVADRTEIYPGENVDIDVKASLYGLNVYAKDENFSWGVSEDNGYVLEDGTYFPGDISDNTEIFAYLGDMSGKLSIKIKPYPFLDIEGHWSVLYACSLFDKGVTVGELTDLGRMYFPDRTYTRNEFCTMLSRIMGYTTATDTVESKEANDHDLLSNVGEEQTQSVEETQVQEEKNSIYEEELFEQTKDTLENVIVAENETQSVYEDKNEFVENKDNDVPENSQETVEYAETVEQTKIEEETVYGKTLFFDDAQIPEWAYDSVCALYEKGLLSDFAHSSENGMIFDGNSTVTRREVMSVIGRICATAPEDYEISFIDYDFADNDSHYVKNAAFSGIIQGYEDNSLRPDGILTRAEGAAVFVRLAESMSK